MGWGEGSRDNFISGSTSCYDNRNLFISDKKAACYSLGGYLKYEERDTLLECEIECCNSSRCNTQNLSLTQDAVTVFTPEGIIVNIFKLYTYFTEPELCEFTVDVCHAWTTPLGLHQPSAENGLAMVTCSLLASYADVRTASSRSLPTNVCKKGATSPKNFCVGG